MAAMWGYAPQCPGVELAPLHLSLVPMIWATAAPSDESWDWLQTPGTLEKSGSSILILRPLVFPCSNKPEPNDQLVIKLCWSLITTRSFVSGVKGRKENCLGLGAIKLMAGWLFNVSGSKSILESKLGKYICLFFNLTHSLGLIEQILYKKDNNVQCFLCFCPTRASGGCTALRRWKYGTGWLIYWLQQFAAVKLETQVCSYLLSFLSATRRDLEMCCCMKHLLAATEQLHQATRTSLLWSSQRGDDCCNNAGALTFPYQF